MDRKYDYLKIGIRYDYDFIELMLLHNNNNDKFIET